MKKIITALTLLVGLFMGSDALAFSKVNKVWASGNVVYGQATLSGNDMPGVGHVFTVKARLVSPTGRTTGWVTRVTQLNTTNVLTVPFSLLSDYGSWTFEATYNVFCPKGLLNSTETASTLFTYGHSTNCLFIIPGTQQIVPVQGGKKWYALYKPAVGCQANCIVSSPYGALSKVFYVPGSAPDPYINMKYTWVFLSIFGQRYCLDAWETGRNPCTKANCGDNPGF